MTAMLWMLATLTLSGSALALFALCLSPLLRRRPAAKYYLWLLVVLRLLLPFAPEANLMSGLSARLDAQAVRFTPVQTEDAPAVPSVQAHPGALVYVPVDGEDPNAAEQGEPLYMPDPKVVSGIAETTRRLAAFGAARVWLFIWLFGAGAALLPQLWSHYRLLRLLRETAEPPLPEQQAVLDGLYTGRRRVRLCRSRAADTPLTFGVLRPVIALPDQAYTPDELRYILLHELTHVRRFDVAYKWLLLAATGAHWFNPLVRYMEREISRACERSCDAAVVRGLNIQERIAYCRTLLQTAAGRRQSLPTAALGEGGEALKERIESALSFRTAGRRARAGCALLLASAAVLGLLLGCSSGSPVKSGGGSDALDETARIDALCVQWGEAAWTRDAYARNTLLAQPGDRPDTLHLFPIVRDRPDCRLRSYTYDFDAGGEIADGREWGYADFRYVMEDDGLNLYRFAERLTLTHMEDGWRVLEHSESAFSEPSCFMEFVGIRDEGVFLPEYTEDDLRRMEAEKIGLYGLSPSEAAVKALHLSGGTVIRPKGAEDARCWYHWEDGDAAIWMGKPEGHELWIPERVELDVTGGVSYLDARHMILNGLPGGWETADELPTADCFRCGVYDPDGNRRCTFAVDWRTGRMAYLDSGIARDCRESPIYDVLEARSVWEGEFYPSRQEERRTTIHRIGERAFSYSFPDGASGMGQFSGNQGWTDDGKYLFLWCADGCNLEIYRREADGALRWAEPERLQSDLFDVRYRERWEQNHGAASGIAPDEAQALAESALPDGYTVERQGEFSDWYLLAVLRDGERLCTLAVSSRNAEFRTWDEERNELRPYEESLVYPAIAERCAWDGSFVQEGSPGFVSFWPEAEGLTGFSVTGAAGPEYLEPSANQLFHGNEMFLWDGGAGEVLAFQLGEDGAVVREDGAYYQRLKRWETDAG